MTSKLYREGQLLLTKTALMTPDADALPPKTLCVIIGRCPGRVRLSVKEPLELFGITFLVESDSLDDWFEPFVTPDWDELEVLAQDLAPEPTRPPGKPGGLCVSLCELGEI